jgi:phosphoglycolate phosphatase
MKYNACIFDLDGTILDTIDTIAYFGNLALSRFGLSRIETEKYKYFAGNGAVKLVSRMLESVGIQDEPTFQKVFEYYIREYNKNASFKTKVFDGINELLNELIKRGVKLGVLSNKPHDATCSVVKEFFGENTFSRCIGQRGGYPMKPNPKPALDMAQDMGANPGEVIYVGDTSVDMETGKRAGFYTVGVLWGFRKEDELIKSGADLIVSKPLEILAVI